MTTDTIKALRDALTECRNMVGHPDNITMIDEALALTADASEDAPPRSGYDGVDRALDRLEATTKRVFARPAPVAATPASIPVWQLFADGWDSVDEIDADWLQTLPLGTRLYYIGAAATAAPIAEVTGVSSLTQEQWTHVQNAAFALNHFGKSDLSNALAEVCAACEIHPVVAHAKPEPVGLCAPFPGMGTEWTPEAEAKLYAVLAEYPPEPKADPVAHAKLAEGAEAYLESMKPRANLIEKGVHLWTGWALVDAFKAGQQAGAVDGEAPDNAAGWIPCNERLPECSKKKDSFGVEVIVYPQPSKGESTAFYGCRITDTPDFYKYGSRVDGVTHWMPLPAPPKAPA